MFLYFADIENVVDFKSVDRNPAGFYILVALMCHVFFWGGGSFVFFCFFTEVSRHLSFLLKMHLNELFWP